MAGSSELTPKQEAFAAELAKGQSQAAAYRIAYPASKEWKDESVWSSASTLASDPKVSQRAAELRKAASFALGADIERVFKEAARIALFDPRKMFDDDGKPLHISRLDDDTAAAISGLEIVTKGNSEMGFGEVLKVKIADKNAAIEKLFKFHGMYIRDNAQKTDPLADVLREIAGLKPSLPVADDD